MREYVKALLLKSIPSVRKLFEHRNELLSFQAVLVGKNEGYEKQLRDAEGLLALANARIALMTPPPYQYDSDWLRVWGKNLASLKETRFTEAYRKSSDPNIDIAYRAYICCWAAEHALNIPGDFVECGVNEGWISRTICHYLDFNKVSKTFYLFDTYDGIPADQISDEEARRASQHNYQDCYELAKSHFSPFERAKLVRGKVPDSLKDVEIGSVSYLSIDMNIEKPERAAVEHFWPKLSPGAIVVLDDYGFEGYEKQHASMNDFAAKVGVPIVTLPTGQGLILKP